MSLLASLGVLFLVGPGILLSEARNAALIDQLRSRNPQTRLAAVRSLDPQGVSAAPVIAELVRLLLDPDADVHWAAEKLLVKVGEPAVPWLIKGLDDKLELRGEAIYVLRQIGPPAQAAVPKLLEFLDQRDRVSLNLFHPGLGRNRRWLAGSHRCALQDFDRF